MVHVDCGPLWIIVVVLEQVSVFVQISQYTIAEVLIRKCEFIQAHRKMLVIKALVVNRLMVRGNELHYKFSF